MRLDHKNVLIMKKQNGGLKTEIEMNMVVIEETAVRKTQSVKVSRQ